MNKTSEYEKQVEADMDSFGIVDTDKDDEVMEEYGLIR